MVCCDICDDTGFLDCESCGGEGGWGGAVDNMDIDICYWCQGSGQGDFCPESGCYKVEGEGTT